MHAEQIQQIAEWLAATDISHLELHGPGQMLLLLRHDGGTVDVVEGDGTGTTVPTAARNMPASSAATAAATLTAPSVGVFLHRHPLRADPLAAPGSRVRAGQALGLLQVGPLLLPVPAPADATVIELLVAHGTAVGYGAPLVAWQAATVA